MPAALQAQAWRVGVAYTFGDVIRRVKLRCATIPILLIEDIVQTAYNTLLQEKDWSFLKTETTLQVQAARTGTCLLTQGSPTVQGVSLLFVASDAGRQFRSGEVGRPFTILSVDLGLNQATLDSVFTGTSAAAAGAIVFDAYITAPSDFGHWIAVIDTANTRRVRVYATDESLNRRDPARQSPGDPWALVSFRYSTYPPTAGQVLYEFWPYWFGEAARFYPAWYVRKPQLKAEDDILEGPLRDRGDVLVHGALAEAYAWRGEEGRPNPAFDLKAAELYRGRFLQAGGMLEVADENIYMTWLQQQPWYGWDYGMDPEVGPGDARYLQSHE